MPLSLSPWFRRRMLPLVVGASVAGAAASPAVYYAQKRHELVSGARAEALRVAVVLAEAAQQRPRLWSYDTAKIAERLASEGVAQQGALVVHDARGARVPLGGAEGAGGLWGRAEVRVGGHLEATVWIGADEGPLRAGTARVGAVSALLSLLLGALLFLVPTRAIAAAERRIAALMGQLELSLREEERGRIARDLHDGAGQALTAARLHLSSLRKAAGEPLRARVEAAAGHIDEALEEIRRSTAALRPPALAELGLRGAIERLAEAFSAASGIEVSCELEPMPPMAAHVETALYRIVQEALTNAARHAGATRVAVRLAARPAPRLTVDDDGRGIGGPDDRPASIAERARLLGGEARFVDLSPGLRVEVQLPPPEEAP